MALAIRRSSSTKRRLLTTLITVFALVMQPLVALDAPSAFAIASVDGVIINEFSSESSSDWVELYNTTNQEVKLNGLKLQDNTGDDIAVPKLNNQAVPANGYLTVAVGDRLNKAGDTITLLRNSNSQISVPYGNAANKIVEAPGAGQTAGLVDGGWQILNTPTPGKPNAANAPLPVIQPVLVPQDFATWDNMPAFKGFNVGFAAHNFGEVTSVTVDVLRADNSHVVRTAGPEMLALLSQKTAPTSGSASFVIAPGTSNGLTGSGWWSGQTELSWTSATKPMSATITVVGANGTKSVTNPNFLEGDNEAHPAYQAMLVSPVAVDTTPPTTSLVAPTGTVGNTFTVSGVAKDDRSLNRVYVQLVNRQDSQRYGGTTIHLSGTEQNWSRTFNATELGLPEGAYAAHVAVVDNAGNTTSQGWSTDFRLDKNGPTFQVTSPAAGAIVSTRGTNKLVVRGSFDDIPGGSGANYITLQLVKDGLDRGVYTTHGPVHDGVLAEFAVTGFEDGDYYINVLGAADMAGNWSTLTSSTRVIIDNTAPVAAIASHNDGDAVSGVVTLVGEVQDQHPMNTHFLITGPNNYKKTDTKKDGRLQHSLAWDVTSLPRGTYTIQFETRDQAGNKTDISTKKISLNVNVPSPEVNGENFSTNSDAGYKGINVGFNIAHFTTVTGVKVELFNGDTPLVANTHNDKLLELINGGASQLSTPFITVAGVYEEQYWNLGSYAWSSTSPRPTHAVVTVTGTNALGGAASESATLQDLTEPNGWTFASILPTPTLSGSDNTSSNPPSRPLSQNDGTGGEALPDDTSSTPGNATAAPLFTNPIFGFGVPSLGDGSDASDQGQGAATNNDNRDVLGDRDQEEGTPLSDTGEVLGIMDHKLFGIAWYWYLVIFTALVGGWLFLAAAIRRSRGADLQ